MSRPVRLAFACLAGFLVLLPLSLKKPGLPMGLAGTEATYFSMASSLVADFDLRCDRWDLQRLFGQFPFAGEVELDLGSDDDWASARFDRPLIYPLLAAPWVAAWGANGLIALNAVFFLLALAGGWLGLRQISSDRLALLFSAGFFCLSAAFSYLFRMQPQIMVMAAVTAAMALGWSHPPGRDPIPWAKHRAWLSGAALGVAVLQEPVLIALSLPLLSRLLRSRRRDAANWLAACCATLALGALCSLALTGSVWPNPQGRSRAELTVSSPLERPWRDMAAAVEQAEVNGPRRSASDLLEDAAFFLWGRRTGILPYFPLIIPILGLFVAERSRPRHGWLLLATLAGLGISQVICEPVSGAVHEAQIGNPHMVGIYPVLLFLIPRLPRTMIVASYGLGALVLGALLSTSLAVVVPGAGIHSHTRNLPLRALPFEYPALGRASGFHRVELYGLDGAIPPGAGQGSARLWAPSDQSEMRGDELWLLGGESVELWLESRAPLPSAVFYLRNLAPDNRVSLRLAGEEIARDFGEIPVTGVSFRLEFEPRKPDKVRHDGDGDVYYYRLRLKTKVGEQPKWRGDSAMGDYVGVALAFLGTREFLGRDLYAMEWLSCGSPPGVTPGEELLAVARLRNLSDQSWPNRGPARVRLSYRWRHAGGEDLPLASLRTELPRQVEPGGELASWLAVGAPAAPGMYSLELEPLFENVAWFSHRVNGSTCRLEVEVRN